MKSSTAILVALFSITLGAAPSIAAEPTNKMDAMDHKTMDHSAMPADMCGSPMGEGVINAVTIAKSTVNITHKPIAAIDWPEMTMDFTAQKSVDLAAFGEGDKVHFMLTPAKKAKGYFIAGMCSLDAAEGAHEACMAQMHNAAMALAEEAGKPCAMEGMDHSSMGKKEDTATTGDATKDHNGHH